MSQRRVADAVGLSASWYSRAERAKIGHRAIADAARVAAVLGLDLVVRTYPGGAPIRDSAHAERLGRVLSHVRAPLHYRVEVPLRQLPDRPEPRAWDAMLYGGDRRTAIELEMRVHDAQAMVRRHALKRRDDPVDGFLLVMAATRTNRRVLADYAGLFAHLPRLRTQLVIGALENGAPPASHHPDLTGHRCRPRVSAGDGTLRAVSLTPQVVAPPGSAGAATPGVSAQLQTNVVGRCYRCGRPTRSPDFGLCDTCNPSGIAGPTATQVHGLILASVAGALIAMALVAKLLASSTGPFPAAVTGQAVGADGTVQIVMRLTNGGATSARPTCTLIRAPGDSGVEFLAERIEPGASIVITKRMPAPPSGSADGLAQVTCR